MFSILHISDLHRSHEEPADNASLIASLVADRDRYIVETPIIPPPEAIVVSGDLIHGASVNATNWSDSLKDQYEVAGNFLVYLCERFLDGDRSRLILTPGNHDVCWNTSYQAMQKVQRNQYPNNLRDDLIIPGTSYRWSWKSQVLFQITNQALYEKRMGYYWNFVESFYNGFDLPIEIDRARGFHLFEVCDRRILISAFESLDGNDCFNGSGSIASGAVGKCAMQLRDAGRSYDMKVAVWHHSIQGPPNHSDYMDAAHVHEMIGHGFQLGLHGHQHVADTLNPFVHLDQSRSMAVVSAGSLCAGARQLPRGVNRQYNLIVINDEFTEARIHVREMAEGGQFTAKRNSAFFEGFVKVGWQPPTDVMGRRSNAQEGNISRAIDNAEIALKNGRLADAVQMLSEVDAASHPFARNLMIEALLCDKEWVQLISFLENPNSIKEKVTLVSAFIETGELDEAESRLTAETEVEATTRADLQERINVKRMMRQS